MRDSDVIMTPFEYDENPWDGLGALDNVDANSPVLIPLDGDPSTDENKGETIDWVNISTTGGPKKITTLATAEAPTALNQTRSIVFGRRAAGVVDHGNAGPARSSHRRLAWGQFR